MNLNFSMSELIHSDTAVRNFDEQDKRLDEHNNFITRVYELERKDGIKEEQIKVANHRIEDLENVMK